MRKIKAYLAAITIVMLGATPVIAIGQSKAAAPAATANPLKSLKTERDDMRGITWYQHPATPKHANSNGFFLYFGKEDKGGFTALRLVARYYDDDWLFVTRAWAKADGVTVDVPQKADKLFGWERDNAAGGIWEWSDIAVIDPSEVAAVRTLANAKNVTVRYEGKQYYNDRKLSAQQLKALQEVIGAYEAATGKSWK